MSERESFDWNDNENFADLDDNFAPDTGGDSLPVDSFSDLEDMTPFESTVDNTDPVMDDAVMDSAAMAVESAGIKQESEDLAASNEMSVKPVRRPKTLSAKGLGLIYGFSLLTVAAGFGGALILALGADPLTLWDPSGLTQFDKLIDFQNHPLNILYLVAVGTALLGLLGSLAIFKATRIANQRTLEAEKMLASVAGLRIENEADWKHTSFNANADIRAFLDENLGTFRLLQSRQQRQIELEGELHRLQKALSDETRSDLTVNFTNPLAGTLADTMLRFFDERESARMERDSVKIKHNEDSDSLISIVQDARSWNRSTLDQIGIQGAALERVAGHAGELSSGIAQIAKINQGSAKQKQQVEKVRQGLVRLDQTAARPTTPAAAGQINELVDRGSKLAFKIAMEVARLGTKGDRLLPMTQEFEELTTEFRTATSRLLAETAASPVDNQAVKSVEQDIVALAASFNNDLEKELSKLMNVSEEVGPSSGRISGSLTDIARSFNSQADRLTNLGVSFSELTGAEFNVDKIVSGNPDNPPEGGLNLSQHDPFSTGAVDIETPADVDPFASAPSSSTGDKPAFADSIFSSNVTPGFESSFDSSDLVDAVQDPTPSEVPDPAPSVVPNRDEAELSSFKSTPVETNESTLSQDEDKVYDIAELGGVLLGDVDEPAQNEDKVYDLAEFGAVQV